MVLPSKIILSSDNGQMTFERKNFPLCNFEYRFSHGSTSMEIYPRRRPGQIGFCLKTFVWKHMAVIEWFPLGYIWSSPHSIHIHKLSIFNRFHRKLWLEKVGWGRLYLSPYQIRKFIICLCPPAWTSSFQMIRLPTEKDIIIRFITGTIKHFFLPLGPCTQTWYSEKDTIALDIHFNCWSEIDQPFTESLLWGKSFW
jgi:hypothetical protein